MDFWGDLLDVGGGQNYYEDYLDDDLENGICSEEGLKGRFFAVGDYIVLGMMFLISISIGVFYGIRSKRKKTTATEYLMGNRQMHYLPVALSIVASLLSAISVLGYPTEMYFYGSQLYMFCLAFIVSSPLAINLYLPVYENLRLTSAYEYLSLRFHTSIRVIFSVGFLIQGLLHCSMAVYAPSIALSQVTNLRVYIVVLIMFSICIIYGSLGGVKAIIWSDTIQIIILAAALVALVIKGTIVAGGPEVIWNDNLLSGRIELFNFDPDPTIRHTFWTVFVGGTVYWVAICAINQTAIQRFLSLPNIREANKAVLVATIGKIIVYTILFYIGMLIYNAYKNCDPVASKMVKRGDQLLLLYLMDVMQKYPGFPGLLVAAILCTSLGSVATMLNGMAAVTIRDFVVGILGKNLTDVESGTLSKILCLGYGIISLAFVFIIAQMGGILQANFSLVGLVAGVTLGVFTLGMYFPWCNWKGALGGTIFSNAFLGWISWGAVTATKDGNFSFPKKPLSVEACLCNATLDIVPENPSEVFPLYKVSYLWYTSIGLILSIISGIVISGLTHFQDPRDLDPALISPIAQWVFNKLPLSARTFLKLPYYEMAIKDEDMQNSTSISIGTKSSATVIEEK